MLLFPIGVVLALLYLGTTFFHREEAPAPVIVVVDPTPVEAIEPVLADESTSTDSLFTSTSTLPTTTPTVKASSTIPTKQAAKKPISSSPLHLGIYGDGWTNNSWGTQVSHEAKSATLLVVYHQPWEAFSVYSQGVTTTKHRSVELVYTSKNTDPRALFLSLYNGATRLGSVPLFPYQVPAKFGMFRIPLGDIATTSPKFTDIVVESSQVQVVQFSELRLTDVGASSHLSEVYPAESSVVTPQPVVQPEPSAPEEVRPVAPRALGEKVYFGGLKDGWQVVTRRGTMIESTEDENQSVTGKSIRLFFTKQDGSLSFEHTGGVDTTGYRYLHMKIYAGVTDHEWQQLIITLYGANGEKLGTRDVMMYSGNGRLLMQTWNNANIPLRELGATDTLVKAIDIENVNVTQEGDHVWIDDVRFIDDYTAI